MVIKVVEDAQSQITVGYFILFFIYFSDTEILKPNSFLTTNPSNECIESKVIKLPLNLLEIVFTYFI